MSNMFGGRGPAVNNKNQDESNNESKTNNKSDSKPKFGGREQVESEKGEGRPQKPFKPKNTEELEESPVPSDNDMSFEEDTSPKSASVSDSEEDIDIFEDTGGFEDNFMEKVSSEEEDNNEETESPDILVSEKETSESESVDNNETIVNEETEIFENQNLFSSDGDDTESEFDTVLEKEVEQDSEALETDSSVKADDDRSQQNFSVEDLENPQMNEDDILSKFEELRKKHEKLQEKRTQYLTIADGAKKEARKYATEVKNKLGLNSIEELESWLEQEKINQQKQLEIFEKDLKKAEKQVEEIEEILKEDNDSSE